MPKLITSHSIDHATLLQSIPFFSELSDENVQWFLDKARFAEYPKKSFLFQRGDSADLMYIIIDGWVKLYQTNREGEETVQAILTRGDSFGEETSLENGDYLYNAQVAGNTTKCLIIPSAIIRERIKKDPNIAIKILTALTHHLAQTSLMYDHFTKLTAAQRLAAFILKLSMSLGYTKTMKLPYNKLLVASRLCMQPETFSRAIKRLEEDTGTSINKREITISDIETLQNYCEVYCCQDKECSLEEQLTCSDQRCDLFRFLKLM